MRARRVRQRTGSLSFFGPPCIEKALWTLQWDGSLELGKRTEATGGRCARLTRTMVNEPGRREPDDSAGRTFACLLHVSAASHDRATVFDDEEVTARVPACEESNIYARYVRPRRESIGSWLYMRGKDGVRSRVPRYEPGSNARLSLRTQARLGAIRTNGASGASLINTHRYFHDGFVRESISAC
ncbi:hypothetical protein PHLGIDRAFT_452176 [Phlebiopsis gigantea 11061_1 CR5-6]|uniref:Uncharacterized protein n=1 Tax=Phlebiopsis gigantea (strain 11061_1 CR5-6) TaxID=745531 RepID=A0A0C3RXG2_PHLG1|nr:hypothetical protein PHLGIDRAFT_452176 [Phlebiopsis gigantea 11061_1 CR5-6]